MPCLSDKFDPSIGPLINVGVLAGGTLTPTSVSSAQVAAFPALIDTGASVTCISPGIAQSLGLQPLGMRPVVSATQAVPANVYLVDLLLPFGNTVFFILGTQVLEFSSAGGSPFQILIGRDIICRGTLVISPDGHFTFCL